MRTKIALGIVAALGLSVSAWADQETEIEISEDDGEITVETDSDGGLPPGVSVQIGNQASALEEQRLRALAAQRSAAEARARTDALLDAESRALRAEDRAAAAERAAARASSSARDAELARFEAESRARLAERPAPITSSVEYRVIRPADRQYDVIVRFEEVRETQTFY